ncbi:hypothetical protein AVEN_216869-1 [Araneus ventricosus]|uniref:Uncharacterized protein n=1 Tax=Araneus ventricosus TaxID=182803 RepID=A0A4Y2GEV1_ARAVE|nr:hypothetical protein AVEN_216869-1 [Araneus ventricosus]
MFDMLNAAEYRDIRHLLSTQVIHTPLSPPTVSISTNILYDILMMFDMLNAAEYRDIPHLLSTQVTHSPLSPPTVSISTNILYDILMLQNIDADRMPM